MNRWKGTSRSRKTMTLFNFVNMRIEVFTIFFDSVRSIRCEIEHSRARKRWSRGGGSDVGQLTTFMRATPQLAHFCTHIGSDSMALTDRICPTTVRATYPSPESPSDDLTARKIPSVQKFAKKFPKVWSLSYSTVYYYYNVRSDVCFWVVIRFRYSCSSFCFRNFSPPTFHFRCM